MSTKVHLQTSGRPGRGVCRCVSFLALTPFLYTNRPIIRAASQTFRSKVQRLTFRPMACCHAAADANWRYPRKPCLHASSEACWTSPSVIRVRTKYAILLEHLKNTKRIHEKDLREGAGRTTLPDAIARKYPNADSQWGWQFVFPASSRYFDRVAGVKRRHHVDESVIQRL